MGNSPGKGKNGGEWTSKVYFDPNASDSGVPLKLITDDELKERLAKLIKIEEKIETISVYKNPLQEWQVTDYLLHHQFVVFETKQFWWSIEKNTEGITIQRSKELDAVKNRYRTKKRLTPVERMIRDDGRYNMQELVNFLYKKDELNKEYSWSGDNCKDFAQRIFNKFAKTKTFS